MKAIAFVLTMLIATSAHAGITEDLCTLAKAETHGFRCKVNHGDDSYTLLIKKDVRESDTEEKKANARVRMADVIESHFRTGGDLVLIRFIGIDGKLYERSCIKIKNTYKPSCYDAVRIKE